MSWTWAGFFRDDPVFRFKPSEFFQSGRHKAEERFWDKQIHGDGGYRIRSHTLPARYRYIRHKVEGKPGYSLDDVAEEENSEKEKEKQEGSESSDEEENREMERKREEVRRWEERRRRHKERKMEEVKKRMEKGGKVEGEEKEKEEVMSNFTCASCSKCSQPIPSAERWSSRFG